MDNVTLAHAARRAILNATDNVEREIALSNYKHIVARMTPKEMITYSKEWNEICEGNEFYDNSEDE